MHEFGLFQRSCVQGALLAIEVTVTDTVAYSSLDFRSSLVVENLDESRENV